MGKAAKRPVREWSNKIKLPPYIEGILANLALTKRGGGIQADLRQTILKALSKEAKKKGGLTYNKVPKFMEPGSYGPLVIEMQKALNAWLKEVHKGSELYVGFYSGGIFLGETVRQMIAFQLAHNLNPDAGCGPKTRECLRKYGLDLEARKHSDTGTTFFVQPDGNIDCWIPTVGWFLLWLTFGSATDQKFYFKSQKS